jgi:hypothetical protein
MRWAGPVGPVGGGGSWDLCTLCVLSAESYRLRAFSCCCVAIARDPGYMLGAGSSCSSFGFLCICSAWQ